jgi:hypothetical protein
MNGKPSSFAGKFDFEFKGPWYKFKDMKYFFSPFFFFFLLGILPLAKGLDSPSKKEYVGIFYFNKIFGQVHEARSSFSTGLTTISCGTPLKLFQLAQKVPDSWSQVQSGGYEGHILKNFLDQEMPKDCFQQKYHHFFNALELDLSDQYFWGRLYDQYIMVKTEVP